MTFPAPAVRSALWYRLLLVVVGGALGTAVRAGLLVPWQQEPKDAAALAVPIATLFINLVGAGALGLVVGVLGTRHPSTRAFLGTGVLGGFTTYSAFAVQTSASTATGPWVPLVLAIVSVAGGVLLAGVGVRAGRSLAGRATERDAPEEAE